MRRARHDGGLTRDAALRTASRPAPHAPGLQALLAILLLASPAISRADDVGQARIYFDAGAQAYSAGRYAAAIEAFTQAYAIAPKPQILFSLAQAERRQFTAERDPRHLRDAVAHFRQYVQEVPEGGRRVDAIEALAELESVAARLDAGAPAAGSRRSFGATRILVSTTTRGATVTLDGAVRNELPVLEAVTPGRHKVHVSAPGYYDEERELMAVDGALVPLEVVLRPKPSSLSLVAPNGARLSIDGRPAGVAPLAAPLDVPPGTHLVAVTRTGYEPHVESVVVERGETVTVRPELRVTRQRKVAIGILSTGAAGVLGAGALAIAAVAKEAQAKDALAKGRANNLTPAERDAFNASVRTRDTLRTGSFVTLGAAAGLLGIGAGVFVFDDREPSLLGQRPASAFVRIGPCGAVLGACGSF